MRTAKERLIILFQKYLADKSIGKLEAVQDFINRPEFQRLLEGGFHFEEVAKYLTDEGIAKFQALKDFCGRPEFQKILREGGLKDNKIVKDLRENTILREYIDLPQFQVLIKPGLKYDPEVQSILGQIDKEFAEIKNLGFKEWNERIEQEKKKKEEESAIPQEPYKENPKKWLPFYFNAYLKHLSTDRLADAKEYLDSPGVQVELQGEFKDDEELQSIASQINKLWDDYQKDEEEKKRKLIEYWDKVEQDRKKYQLEQEEEERKSRDSKTTIPRFD